jgi:hypothetical protein
VPELDFLKFIPRVAMLTDESDAGRCDQKFFLLLIHAVNHNPMTNASSLNGDDDGESILKGLCHLIKI